MDGTGDYYAKQNKPVAKNQRVNVFSDTGMLIHNKMGQGEYRYFGLDRGVKGEEGAWDRSNVG